MSKIVAMFFAWRTFGFVIIFLSSFIVPYLGFFPYGEIISRSNLPQWISSLANFDGVHYVLIARNGYSQYEQAFFPLYPILIRHLAPLFFNNHIVSGLVISNLGFLSGLVLAKKVFSLKNNWFYLFLLSFPTSFFFGSVYNEGLFFMFVVFSLYFFQTKKRLLFFLVSALASLTRLVGFFLAFFAVFSTMGKKHLGKNWVFFVSGPALGLLTYCLYLWISVGDPLFFLNSQPAFGANRSSQIIVLPQVYWRYAKIFLTAAHDFRYFVSMVEFTVFNLVFFVLILDFFKHVKLRFKKMPLVINPFRLGLNIFSMSNLVLPTLTGTLSSVPRYSLLSLSFFLYLSEIRSGRAKTVLILLMAIFQILLLAFFSRGYFIS